MTHPTPHALRIPEILSIIFGFAGPAVNAVSAQVCKLWSHLALDVLWEEVDDLPRLLGLLSPLERGEYGIYDFQRRPSEIDWKQFERYATRVRRLKYDGYPTLSDDAFEMLDRGQAGVFPNLQTLEWDAPVELCSMCTLMHSCVKKLVIYLRDDDPLFPVAMRVSFQDIIQRMPNLAILDIRSNIPVRNFEEDLAHLLQGLPRLQDIVLPCFYFTTKIAECLSHAEHLSSIDFQLYDAMYRGDSLDVALFSPTLTEGAFPLLSKLSMFANFNDATRFVKGPFSPDKLTQFYSDSYVIDTPDSAHRLLLALSENCQLLRELEISSKLDPSTTNITDKTGGYITLDTIKPIFGLSHLVVFQFDVQFPLLMTQQDIGLLASSCPALESLRLGLDSIYLTESTLTLAALIPFAQHCPNLNFIALFMDATTIKVPEISLTTAPEPFKSLRFLCVGYSIIDDWSAPAIYLSHLLAPDCVIMMKTLWHADDMSEELRNITETRDRLWEKVKVLVPELSKVRAQNALNTGGSAREHGY